MWLFEKQVMYNMFPTAVVQEAFIMALNGKMDYLYTVHVYDKSQSSKGFIW